MVNLQRILVSVLLLSLLLGCQSERQWCLENELQFEEFGCMIGLVSVMSQGGDINRQNYMSSACLVYAIKTAKCEAKSDCSLAHLAGCSFTFK